MSFSDVIFTGVSRRREAIDEARAAGRLGSKRVPLALVADESLSDTCIRRLPAAVELGREQRTGSDDYGRWLVDNAERLSQQVMEAGIQDCGPWFRQQYTIETGKQP